MLVLNSGAGRYGVETEQESQEAFLSKVYQRIRDIIIFSVVEGYKCQGAWLKSGLSPWSALDENAGWNILGSSVR